MSQAHPLAASPAPLTPIERSALHRVALGKGDLVPVHWVHARALEARRLVRVVPPTERDKLSALALGEVWGVITEHGRAVDAMQWGRS